MIAAAWLWLWQHLLPKRLVSAVVYSATRSRRAWLRRPLVRWFVNAYGVNMQEAANADLESYTTFNDFFTRELKAGARPLEGGALRLIAPADGVLTEFGAIDEDQLLQAKGLYYSLSDLLGEQSGAVDALRGGSFFTIYLAPHDYHRVHAPLASSLERTRYIPGERFSVSRATAAVIRRLFCRNERAVCWFASPQGSIAVVFVGALNVSSITTLTRGEIPTGPPQQWLESPPVAVAQGAEIGRFNMGSTVVVLASAHVTWLAAAKPGAAVRMGQALAELLPASPE
jgi:phosphatidylserine decarboxylase